jgi:serine/threonine protein kinase
MGTWDPAGVRRSRVKRAICQAHEMNERTSSPGHYFPASRISIGQVLDGRFRIIGLVREGGMSSVFEAVDGTNGGRVAIKVPFLKYDREPVYFSRFQQEEALGLALDHPSLLHLLSVKDKSRSYLVMELLEGKLLADLLEGGRSLPVPQALSIAARIAEAVVYMHGRRIIHRDLKPGNVMMCKDGSLRVIDFGLARNLAAPPGSTSGSTPIVGTPDYMPPEHVRGKPGDERSDIYCLGAMLYEMVTGSLPFTGIDMFSLMNARLVGDPVAPTLFKKDLPSQIEEIILHAMERDPESRYGSMADLRKDLEAYDRVVPTGRAGRLKAPSPWKLRWRRYQDFVWALLVILVIFFLIVMAVAASSSYRGVRHRGRFARIDGDSGSCAGSPWDAIRLTSRLGVSVRRSACC